MKRALAYLRPVPAHPLRHTVLAVLLLGVLCCLVVPMQDAAGVPSECPLSPRLALGEVLREGIQFALYRVKV